MKDKLLQNLIRRTVLKPTKKKKKPLRAELQSTIPTGSRGTESIAMDC